MSLSSGVDETLEAASERLDGGDPVKPLRAMAAEIPPHSHGRGLARQLLEAMRTIAAQCGLHHLVAAVRPSMKERYPFTAVER